MNIVTILQYGFIERALITGSIIALLCAMLGVVLVLRRMSMMGDGLSHVSFGAIALGLLLGITPIYIAIPLVVIVALFMMKLSTTKIYSDTTIGIMSSVGLAIGVVCASASGGFNVDIMSYLFGNILAIGQTEMMVSIGITLIVGIIMMLLYQDILYICFNEEQAKASGIAVEKINTVLTIVTAIVIVMTVQVVGIMLVSALLLLPAASALQIARGFKATMVIASIIGVISVIIGVLLSVIWNVPTGALIVLVNAACFSIALLIKK